jgi:hypothetical protein
MVRDPSAGHQRTDRGRCHGGPSRRWTVTQVQHREQAVERPPEAPPRPSGLVPWIQWLGFAVVLLVVGLVVWVIGASSPVTDTDGSFQYNEMMRMAAFNPADGSFDTAELIRMQGLNPLPPDGSFEHAEATRMQALNPLPADNSFEVAEMLRFQRILERTTG